MSDDMSWLLSSEHGDHCAMEWINPGQLRRMDRGTQPELNGYTWWFCTVERAARTRLQKTLLCKEHSDQMMLERLGKYGVNIDD